MKKALLFFLLVMFGIDSAKAQFSGGSGTEDDPYLISCEDDLYDISTNLSAYYKLTCDLDLTEWIQDENPKQGWEPIGTSAKPFTGTFDGNGKTISGLYIKRTASDYIGLFGYASGATIKRLTLESPNASGHDYCSALLGYGTSVNLDDITVTNATVSGNTYSGVVVGSAESDATVSNIRISHANVSGVSNSGVLGGYFFWSPSCHDILISDAIVSGSSSVGACVGGVSIPTSDIITSDIIVENIVIENVQVTGSLYVGGIFGLYQDSNTKALVIANNATIRNMDISGESHVGGVIGYFIGTGTNKTYNNISNLHILNGNVYASGDNAGGVIGLLIASQGNYVNIVMDCCYVDCNVKSETGTANGFAVVQPTSLINGRYTISKISANKCIFNGDVTCTNGDACGFTYIRKATGATGNIINQSPIDQCIFMGSISGNTVNGISYAWAQRSVCYANELSATTSLYRIKTDTESAVNYAYNGTTLLLNDEETNVDDNVQNGTSKSARLLKRKNTYTTEEMGYDFDNDWNIVEGKTLPYLKGQSTPPEITSIVGGIVTGTATGSGKVYVFVGQTMYEGTVTNGEWEVSVGSLAEDTEVKVSVETEGKKPSIIVKAKAGEESVTPGDYDEITLSSTYATYCSTSNLDFSGQTNVKAYAATGYEDGKVVLTRVNVVPAGEGILLKGEAATYRVPHTSNTSYFINLLKGVTTTTNVAPTSGDKTNFILGNGSKGIGFYTISETGPLAAGKAYLQLPTSLFTAGSRMVSMQFEDTPTGIADMETEGHSIGNHNYYDLQGRKMNHVGQNPDFLKKGLYIRDGKKIVIK